MIYRAIALLLLSLGPAVAAEKPPAKMPRWAESAFAQPMVLYDANGDIVSNFGSNSSAAKLTTDGAIEPPTAGLGKITVTKRALPANTSTAIVDQNSNRISMGMQCGNDAGTAAAAVSIDETGATLTGVGMAQGTLFLPASSSGPVYFSPPIATRAAVTAYSATAQRCIVTEYLR